MLKKQKKMPQINIIKNTIRLSETFRYYAIVSKIFTFYYISSIIA